MIKIEKLFDRKHFKNNFNGSLLVSNEHENYIEKYYGYADVENKIPINNLTQFDIGSITKGLTALVIMQLYESKLININHTINQYINDFPFGHQITIHQLLNHTSGLPSYSKNFDVTFYNRLKNIINCNNKLKLSHKGKKFLYSNLGYIVLGYIIEIVTGKKIENVFKTNVFDKVGMYNTSFKNSELSKSHLAVGYKNYEYLLADINFYDQKIGPRGSGGLCSTVLDLNKYMNALIKCELVSKETLKLMLKPNNNYGYGWYVFDKYIEHYGTTFGFRGYIMNRVSDNLKIIILSNVQSTNMRSIAKSVKNIIIN